MCMASWINQIDESCFRNSTPWTHMATVWEFGTFNKWNAECWQIQHDEECKVDNGLLLTTWNWPLGLLVQRDGLNDWRKWHASHAVRETPARSQHAILLSLSLSLFYTCTIAWDWMELGEVDPREEWTVVSYWPFIDWFHWPSSLNHPLFSLHWRASALWGLNLGMHTPNIWKSFANSSPPVSLTSEYVHVWWADVSPNSIQERCLSDMSRWVSSTLRKLNACGKPLTSPKTLPFQQAIPKHQKNPPKKMISVWQLGCKQSWFEHPTEVRYLNQKEKKKKIWHVSS